MCRLFGLNAGRADVSAAYWLRTAPDSLTREGERNPDGSGIGWFDVEGRPHLEKAPEPAGLDPAFEHAARRARSCTFVAHVRAATAGARTAANTHPFLMTGRLMAHNGGFGDLERVEAELGTYRDLVHGDTDSERLLALVTARTDAHGGDVTAGITDAATWLARNVPLYSLNLVLVTPGNLWALRYPDQRSLHVLTRGPTDDDTPWATDSAHQHIEVAHPGTPVVVVASERLDADPAWQAVQPGELVHVGPDLDVRRTVAVPFPPAHLRVPDERDRNDES